METVQLSTLPKVCLDQTAFPEMTIDIGWLAPPWIPGSYISNHVGDYVQVGIIFIN